MLYTAIDESRTASRILNTCQRSELYLPCIATVFSTTHLLPRLQRQPLAMGVASEVYAKELSSRKHGIPLWYPEPADQYEVRVGDVGHLDEDGQFHRLFNVTVGPDHPYNADGVPQDFEPLQFNRRLFASHDNILPPQPITSNGTDASHIQANVSV